MQKLESWKLKYKRNFLKSHTNEKMSCYIYYDELVCYNKDVYKDYQRNSQRQDLHTMLNNHEKQDFHTQIFNIGLLKYL